MSHGMLGKLSLSDVQGPRDALEQHLAGPDGHLWLTEFKKYLRKEPTWQKHEVSPLTLVLVKTSSLEGAMDKKTRDCFTRNLWFYREGSIDSWLPREQTANAGDLVGVYQLQNPKGTTFREMAHAAVQAAPGAIDREIIARLKDRGLTLTLPEIERRVERQESGEDDGLCTDGYNFAFVENADGSVSVLGFDLSDRGWSAGVHRLGYGYRWGAGFRLLLRNSDALAL